MTGSSHINFASSALVGSRTDSARGRTSPGRTSTSPVADHRLTFATIAAIKPTDRDFVSSKHASRFLFFFLFSYLFLFIRRRVMASPLTVFCHAALSMICCFYMVFLYFRFHFAAPDPTWVALTFLVGFTLLFLGHLKNLFFPYESLRAYQPDLPVRLQRPPSTREIWGTLSLLCGTLTAFQGYYATWFLDRGPQYVLIIAGAIELTPVQRVKTMLGVGLVAGVCGGLALLRPPPHQRQTVRGRMS